MTTFPDGTYTDARVAHMYQAGAHPPDLTADEIYERQGLATVHHLPSNLSLQADGRGPRDFNRGDIVAWDEVAARFRPFTQAALGLSGGGGGGDPLLEARVTALENDVAALTPRVTTIESEQLTQDGRLATIESEQLTQNGRLTTLESEQLTQNGRLATLESEQLTQNGRLTTVETANTTQDGRLATIESEQLTQNSRLTSVETVNTTQDGRLTAVETVNTTQDGRLTAVETVNTTQNGRLTTIESEQVTQNSRLTAVETVNTTQNSRLTAVETVNTTQDGRLTTIETTLININTSNLSTFNPATSVSPLTVTATGVTNTAFLARIIIFRAAVAIPSGRVVSFTAGASNPITVTFINGATGEENASSSPLGVTLADVAAGGDVPVAIRGLCSVLNGTTAGTGRRGAAIFCAGGSTGRTAAPGTASGADTAAIGICMTDGAIAAGAPFLIAVRPGFENF